MATVHSTTIIEGDDVSLADDVEVGPGCVIKGPVSIGAGTKILGKAWLQGPLSIGDSNVIYQMIGRHPAWVAFSIITIISPFLI